MKLYELTQEYQSVEAMLQNPDVDAQAVLDTLEAIAGEFEDKADNVACMVKDLEADAKAIKAEADALTQRARARAAKADRLREYLYQQMGLAGIRKIETARNLLQIKKSPESVRVEDESAFLKWAENHPEYLRQKPPEPDKAAIKEAVRAGNAVPGVRLESGETFVIR